MLIEDLTMMEFCAGLEKTRTVLIPVGSVEEHGDHLPLATDTIQAVEVAKKASHVVPLFVAPPINYGNCRSTSCHPGTISIRTATLKALVYDIVSSLYVHGLRNFIILSGHAGAAHCLALQEVGEDLLVALAESRIAVVTEYTLAKEEGRTLVETPGDSHAGEIETSRILHTHPHLVKGPGCEEYPNFPVGILVRDKRKFWPGGVWGNPSKASAAKGKQIEALVVTKVVELVQQLETFKE